MRQLSAHDAALLSSETAHSNANVTLIHIYDQSTAPGGKVRFKSILGRIESRLAALPVFRQRLQRVPLDLDRPYWVDDENFDLEYHVRHIALPEPGDWRQFCIQASRIHARPLDLGRPLWEIHVVEGLDRLLDLPAGSFALLTKTHQAAIDVERGSEITMLLHDPGAGATAVEPPAPWFPERPPGRLRMLGSGAVHAVGASVALAGPLGRVVRRAVPAARAFAGDLLRRAHGLPLTRFNAAVSMHRVFETRRFTLDDFRAIRGLVEGATVNDAVLAICGGALRRYLALHGELPPTSLTAMAPFVLRGVDGPDAGAAPSELSWLRIALGTEFADPVHRLASIHAQTGASAQLARAVGARELTDLARHAPAATLALTGKRLGSALAGVGRRTPLAHCTIANVPGPASTLFLCGARMTYFSAILPIADGMGLVFVVTSYDGRVVISPTSCRELMPDPAVFAQCVRDSFQELLAALPAARPPPIRGSASGRRAPTSRKVRKAASDPRAAPAGRRRSPSPSG